MKRKNDFQPEVTEMSNFKDLKNASFAFYKEYMDIAYHGGRDNLNRQFLMIVNDSSSKKEIREFGNRQCSLLKNGLKSSLGGSGAVFQKNYKVTFPGALIGSGYPHITGKMKGEIQNGFCFDHITGAPYYPGSSLKGLLEDPFERALKGRKEEKAGYLYYLLTTISNTVGKMLTEKEVKFIWEQSFKGILPGKDGKRENMFDRDVFFDAYITGVDQSAYNHYHDIIGEDVITPHENILHEPNPITVLRLMPGVRLTITMVLHRVIDDLGGTVLTSEEKLNVFCSIIEDMGIGSRTNLGYGVLKSGR